MKILFKKRERRHQKVYILRIYSIRQYFDKIRAVSLGYPMGMFGVSFGAISCLDREGVYESSCFVPDCCTVLQRKGPDWCVVGQNCPWLRREFIRWNRGFTGFWGEGEMDVCGWWRWKNWQPCHFRTGVTIRKNLVTIRKKVAKRVAYVRFFLYLCSRFWKIRV